MSTYEFGRRMGVTGTRVRQLEVAEVEGRIRLFVLERTAEALNCQLAYVLVPNEPLDQMVRRQARARATELASFVRDDLSAEDRTLMAEVIAEELDVLALQLVDRRGLWRDSAAEDGKTPFRALLLERKFPRDRPY
jgi:predicted DNA-binding mobile mystery protein A